MLETITLFRIWAAGKWHRASPVLIAEVQWNAKKALIKGHPIKDVYNHAIAAFRRKK